MAGLVSGFCSSSPSFGVRYTKDFTPSANFVPDADTIALYRCDEGRGDIVNDSSGKNNHGKIVGAKWAE
ncbi:MAG: hypothetical protein K2X38_02275 [Gemmataceae bacterium]|nr:hypothetical protein [Gemmataceae bacterium]